MPVHLRLLQPVLFFISSLVILRLFSYIAINRIQCKSIEHFVFILIIISGTHEESAIVGIFETGREIDFSQLLLETVGSIGKRFENARNRTGIIELIFRPIICFCIILRISVFVFIRIIALTRSSRNQQLIGIEADRQRIIIINREQERKPETQIGRQERTVRPTVIRDFLTNIRNIESPRELTFATSYNRIDGLVTRNIGCKSRCTRHIFGRRQTSETHIGINKSENDSHLKRRRQLAGIPQVDCHLIVIDRIL